MIGEGLLALLSQFPELSGFSVIPKLLISSAGGAGTYCLLNAKEIAFKKKFQRIMLAAGPC